MIFILHCLRTLCNTMVLPHNGFFVFVFWGFFWWPLRRKSISSDQEQVIHFGNQLFTVQFILRERIPCRNCPPHKKNFVRSFGWLQDHFGRVKTRKCQVCSSHHNSWGRFTASQMVELPPPCYAKLFNLWFLSWPCFWKKKQKIKRHTQQPFSRQMDSLPSSQTRSSGFWQPGAPMRSHSLEGREHRAPQPGQ